MHGSEPPASPTPRTLRQPPCIPSHRNMQATTSLRGTAVCSLTSMY